MTVYFAWVKPTEKFDPKIHARTDENIFDLKICEREGEIPKAHLRMVNPKSGLLAKERLHHAFISYQKTQEQVILLFSGRVIGVPHKIDGETVELIFSAEPKDSQEKLDRLQTQLKVSPFWDDLFILEKSRDNSNQNLEARSALYYWDRCTQDVHLSDLSQGSKNLNIGHCFFRDSLKISVAEVPLSAVKVRVHAEWIQRYQGLTDISFLIRSAFQGLINTLTGPDLQAKWWKTAEKISRSGYWIASADFQEIDPPFTGVLNLYPRVSAPFRISPYDTSLKENEEKLTSPRYHRFKRYWYKSSLILGWHYKQKRREVVEFTLQHAFQSFFENAPRVRSLDFYLNDISLADEAEPWIRGKIYSKGRRVVVNDQIYEAMRKHRAKGSFEADLSKWKQLGQRPHVPQQSHRATFFTTDRGQQALEHALERARVHLAASARAIDIKFTGTVGTLLEVTCDHQIHLEDERLPGNKVIGKVKAYTLTLDGKTGIGKVDLTLGCSVGTPRSRKTISAEEAESYAQNDYFTPDYQDLTLFYQSASGIAYLPYKNQLPKAGIVNPMSLKARDLVEEIKIVNPAHQQEAYLEKNQYPFRHHMEGVLNEIKTDLQIHLRDLHAVETLEHKIVLTLPEPWSAPQQIDLS